MTGVQGFPSVLGLDNYLSEDTRRAWVVIKPFLPANTYLAGGTAVAIHLKHRQSNDLDFFTEQPFDAEALLDELTEQCPEPFQTVRCAPKSRSLEIRLYSTKIEISDGSACRMIEPKTKIAGINVASLGDLLAMKLKAITARKTLRDYEDLRAIEQLGGRRIEEGLALAIERYSIRDEAGVLSFLVAFADVNECPEDPFVLTPRSELIHYWQERLPEITASISRYDVPAMSRTIASEALRELRQTNP